MARVVGLMGFVVAEKIQLAMAFFFHILNVQIILLAV
jgi:hypothetical protein